DCAWVFLQLGWRKLGLRAGWNRSPDAPEQGCQHECRCRAFDTHFQLRGISWTAFSGTGHSLSPHEAGAIGKSQREIPKSLTMADHPPESGARPSDSVYSLAIIARALLR